MADRTGDGGNTLASALEEALKDAFVMKAELDKVDDRLSEKIADVEKALSDLKLGVRLVHDLDETDTLVFDKYGNGWRLVVEVCHPDGDHWRSTPLRDCDRETRARALRSWVPEILLKAAEQMRSMIAERETTLRDTDVLLDVLQKARKEGGR